METDAAVVPDPGPEPLPAVKKRPARRRRVSVSAEVDGLPSTGFVPAVYPKTDEELKRIQVAVDSNFLFGGLSSEQRDLVFGAMNEKKVAAGTEIIKQGDAGDFFYVLDEGSADVHVNGNKVHHYTSGSSFGELALMYNCPRAASVIAVEDCTLWQLDRSTFQYSLCANQSEKRNAYETVLKDLDLFANLTPVEITRIADVMEEQNFEENETVIKQGENDFAKMKFYIVTKGKAKVVIDTETEKAVQVGVIEKGGYFGEKALIEKVPRAATIQATDGPLVCGCLDVAAFERLLGPCKELLARQITKYASMTAEAIDQPRASGAALNAVRAKSTEALSQGALEASTVASAE
mmetsp:Transcript_10977/g.20317  ORF Transcript_10977/g.20317 Transcript_10977/m.20317 type:complete len:350 (-) Transcript_10977:168-1217(-)